MKNKTFIIAEAGVNHNGSIELAKELIDVAASAGADAVKFQTFRTENLVTINAKKAEYQKDSNLKGSENQFEMLKRLELDYETHKLLYDYCKKKNILFLSTPFDLDSIDLLKELGIEYLKIPSGEITNGPYLLKIAQKGLPVFLSTGMANLCDIELALSILAYGYLNKNENINLDRIKLNFSKSESFEILKKNVVLLHATTAYPTSPDAVNLKAMRTLQESFGLKYGYSDHTLGIEISIAAVAMGASVIEKHFTLDKSFEGPDHKASLEPNELKEMVSSIRNVEMAMGSGRKVPAVIEIPNMIAARKSLVAMTNISKGDVFNEINLGSKRPGNGISPIFYWNFLGKVSTRDYLKDELIVE